MYIAYANRSFIQMYPCRKYYVSQENGKKAHRRKEEKEEKEKSRAARMSAGYDME